MKNVIKVDGMSCGHCVKRVTNTINELDGISSVDVSLSEKTVTVEYDDTKASLKDIEEAINEAGYDVV